MLITLHHTLRQRCAPILFRSLTATSAARNSTAFPTKRCSACSAPLPTALPACAKCGHISVLPSTVTAHQLFDLPQRPNPFVVDVSTLRQRFREAQAVVHPDGWASKGPKKQDLAQTLSTRVNEAYNQLLTPLPRAVYILEQNGYDITEHDQLTDIEFISDIMNAREIISESEVKEGIEVLMEETDGKIDATLKEIESYISGQDWERAKEEVIRLRYLEGINRAARSRLDELS
ncbi:hypothetical protein BDN72DRAFT_754327 [Pluteus cervinus]|uniref:Uncharacterized protein n=1 Tax=Pluteus cervinus TaxID=181527 RepID=A0ACD3BFW5_9AGAR|nr:hypothetical protein BDN72DRAFT_754327 [Pluteus cervinus]